MKVKVTELKINPINPRTISKENLALLQQSIMLFPKMLYYNEILVDEDNVILSGNQRVTVLQKIFYSTPVDWVLVLNGNEKWNNLTEAQKDKIIKYWRGWCEAPNVECSLFEGDEEEKKRVIYLDNKNFGEFVSDKLLQISDEDTLLSYGFDHDFFFKEEDATVLVKNTMGKGRKINVLSFGKNTVAVNKEEYDALVKEYDDYLNENGVDFGFIRHLLRK